MTRAGIASSFIANTVRSSLAVSVELPSCGRDRLGVVTGSLGTAFRRFALEGLLLARVAAVNAARRWVAVGRYVGGSIDTLTLCLTAIVFSFVIGELLKPYVCVLETKRAEVHSSYRAE